MSQRRQQIIAGLSRLYSGVDYVTRMRYRTGKLDPDETDGTVIADTTADLPDGYLWIRPEGGRAEVAALIAPGMFDYFSLADLPIWAGFDKGGNLYAIEPRIDDETRSSVGSALTSGQTRNTPVRYDLITGGRVFPSPAGGLKLYVEAYPAGGLYADAPAADPQAADAAYDVSASVPSVSGDIRWIVVYALDGVIGHVEVDPSDPPVLTPDDLDVTTAFDAELPENAYRLAAVSLSYGQTVIDYTTSRFEDLRDHLARNNPLISDIVVDADGAVVSDADGSVVVSA